ncbi:hypothetical protein J6590_019690 [Homalodisca vitripennis]|nr:hypothetical protein J6590_019690 [Homalodisca vitripennis]
MTGFTLDVISEHLPDDTARPCQDIMREATNYRPELQRPVFTVASRQWLHNGGSKDNLTHKSMRGIPEQGMGVRGQLGNEIGLSTWIRLKYAHIPTTSA